LPLTEVIVLAIVQGITEFLPISSSGHLILVRQLFGWEDTGLTFDVALHVGTLFSVLLYFGPTWVRILRAAAGHDVRISGDLPAGALSPEERRRERLLVWFILAATVPAGIAGFLLEDYAETTFRSPVLVASMLIFVAFIMLLSEKAGKFRKDITGISLGDAMIIGVAQATALVPGVSRAGSTIAAGLFRGMTRDAAARFSFLLSTPVIGGAALLKAYGLYQAGGPAPEMYLPFVLGIVISAIVGYLAIAALVHYLRTRTLKIFIVYRIGFGIIILALAFIS
jgi:undecaprenyl-diphosphatase